MKYSLATNLATLGKIGRTRYAPGTLGSFVALWLAPLLFLPFSLPIRILVLTIVFFVGIWASEIASKELNDPDPSAVVIDEVLGQWVCLLPLSPISFYEMHLLSNLDIFILLVGFLLFRIFDITKVGPVGLVERKFSGGLGIMLDDAVAGFFGAIFLFPIQNYLRLFFG